MSNNTSNATLREETTVFADTTTQTTSTEIKSTSTVTEGGGMGAMAVAGTVIGAIVAACVIACLAVIILIRYRKSQKKSQDKYKQTVKNLKIDQLPTPSDVASEELRPPGRKPVTREPEVEPDLGSSVLHYQNVAELKYENVDSPAEIEQPIYLEPRGEDKRLYTTGAGSEYYVVNDDPSKVPNLQCRDDNPKQNNKIRTNVTSDSNTKKTTSHSTKDYVNLKEEIILPPHPKHKDKRMKIHAKNDLAVDEVYENEEIPKIQHSKKPKR
ncbi:uncharacterized protein LOC143047193 [Mytilus galloprovincialis]|uniref:uncharacterized protein LOC143047193 n=1 Tax=Mytilus galloprovincialis TaxID=29158 RepID=UPI003F7B9D41